MVSHVKAKKIFSVPKDVRLAEAELDSRVDRDYDFSAKKSLTELKEGDNATSILFSGSNKVFRYVGPMKGISTTIRSLYGCLKCEWRSTSLCPFGLSESAAASKQVHANGICGLRVDYLKNFYRGEKTRPSFDEWQHDYNQGLAQMQLNKEYAKLQLLESDIKGLDCENPADEDKLNRLVSLQEKLRADWFDLAKTIMIASSKTLDRINPRQVEITHTSIKPSDINLLLKKANAEVVDESVEVVEDV